MSYCDPTGSTQMANNGAGRSQSTDHPQSDDLPDKFSLVAGGAFHALLARLGLLEADGLPSRAAAFGLALLAFFIPALFVVGQSYLDDAYTGWDYFQDPTVFARYLIAVLVMVSTERLADGRIVLMTHYFDDAGLILPEDRGRYVAALTRIDRRADSIRVELIILLIAIGMSNFTTRYAAMAAVGTWEGMVNTAGMVRLSWAGEASAWTSNSLFLFLILRWFWRFYLWASLLWQISSLRMQIMPLHPDRCGGLGFLAIFPGIFSGVVLALSCVVAASLHKALPEMGDSYHMNWLAMGVWLILVLVIFMGPLLIFVPKLLSAKELAVLQYGRLAHGHHLAFHRNWIGENVDAANLLGSGDLSSIADLNGSVETIISMRTFPIDRNAFVMLLASAGIPFVVVAALQMPLGDLMKLLLGVLF